MPCIHTVFHPTVFHPTVFHPYITATISHNSVSLSVTIEAQKCLCNLIFNSTQAQAACR